MVDLVPVQEFKTGDICEPEEVIKLIPGGYDPHRGADAYEFDAERAIKAVQFFHELLTHVKGKLAKTPFFLQPWQQAIVMNIFGWFHRETGLRRFRSTFIFVPRKNGKSTLAGGLVNLVIFTDREHGSEIYSAAAEYKQAALVFDQVKGMILNEPLLEKRVKIYKTFKSIEYEEYNTVYRVISADADSKHGFNTQCAVVDEVHAQPNPELINVLETSTGSRDEPLMIYITTADYQRPSICNTKLDYARQVRDGIIDDAEHLPVVYEAMETDDWEDPEVWKKANPNYGVSLKHSYMEAEAKKASATPSYQNTFRRLHLNVVTQTDVQWVRLSDYDECVSREFPEWKSLKGRPCVAGLDLSSTKDLSSLVLYFPLDGHILVPFFFAPRENAIEREKKDRVPYTQWARDGHMTLTPGNVVDYDYIRRVLSGQPEGDRELEMTPILEHVDLKGLAFDRWGATHLVQQFKNDGANVIAFGQGYASMSPAAKEFEKLLISHDFTLPENPVLRWCANNVMIEEDAAGNIKPSKGKSRERIDGIVAAIMAVGAASLLDMKPKSSVYSKRGIRSL